MAHRLFIHAAARIAHGHDHIAAILELAKDDAPARFRKLDCVGNQVVENNFHHAFVRKHHHALLQLGVKLDVLLFPARFMRKGAVAELAREVIRFGMWNNLLVFQLVEPQNIGNHRAQALAGRGNRRGIIALLLFAQAAPRKRRRIAVDDGQRRFNLMRHIGDEIVLHRLRAAKLPHHAVEVLKHDIHVIELVFPMKGRHANRKIAVSNPTHGAAERAHRLIDLVAAVQMQNDSGKQRHGNPV